MVERGKNLPFDSPIRPPLLQDKTQGRLEQLVLQRQRAAEARQRAIEFAAAAARLAAENEAAAARRAAAADERLAAAIASRQRELGELAAPGAAAHFLPRDYSGLPSDILVKIAALLLAQPFGTGGCATTLPPSPLCWEVVL